MADAVPHYAVERSSRRTIGIYVERDGSVLVRAPQTVSDERIAAVVSKKLPWVYRARARWAQLNPKLVRKEFVSGETVYFLGRPHRLDFRASTAKLLEREGETFILRLDARERAEELLKGYYRAEGLRRLPSMVAQHAESMGVRPGRVLVRELGHRWASCSARGDVNFHWRALAVPVEVLHYLAVHELAHLKHRDHSARFWQVVDAELPGWERHAKWLEERGAEMTL